MYHAAADVPFTATALADSRARRFGLRSFLIGLLLGLFSHPALAQITVTDSFADGDVTQNPSWTGTTDFWIVAPSGPDFALRSNGPAQSDTLTLATASAASYGTWQVTLHYEDGALSNFNQIRLYLLSDGADLKQPVSGYFVQLGTNSRDLRLYRSDAGRADPRVLLAQTEADLLPADAQTLSLTVTRTEPGAWMIAIDGTEVLTHEEATPAVTSGHFFGVWVKHSATRGQSYWFDDVQIDGRSSPADTVSPTVTEATYAADIPSFELTFSELIDMQSVSVSDVSISNGIGQPDRLVPRSGSDATLGLSVQVPEGTVLPTGDYAISISSITDLAGNVIRDTTVTVRVVTMGDALPPEPGEIVVNEIFYDPPITDLEFIELYNRSDRTFELSRLSFSDNRGQSVPASETGAALPPGGYAVLVRDANAFSAAFSGVAFIAPPAWPALNNSGDAVVLYADEVVIDSVAYRPSWGGGAVALERKDPAGPSNAAANWGSSTESTGATPGRRNAIFEIDTTPPELLAATANTGGDTLWVTFSEPPDPSSIAPDNFRVWGGAAPQVPASVTAIDARVLLTFSPPLATSTYTLEGTNIADAHGNVQEQASLSFDVFRPDVPEPGDVVVNELFYAPPDADLEFVELFNRSSRTFDLRQFSLADARLEPVSITDAVTRLKPGGFAVLVRNPAVFAEAFPGVSHVEVAPWPALNDGGDAAALLFGETVVDFVEYTADWGRGGVSMERRDPEGPSGAAVNFGPSAAEAGATPGTQNSLFARDLSPPQPTFAEQTAPTRLNVTFDEPLDAATVTRTAFALDGLLPAALLLLDPARVELRFDEPLGGVRLTMTGLRDLFGNTLPSASLDVTRLPEPGDVLINEILFDPLADRFDDRPDQPEYVEVVNVAPYVVSLSRSFRTNVADEDGDADTLRWGGAAVQVAPGGYAVYTAQSEPVTDPAISSALAEAFSEIDFRNPSITLVPVERSSLNLRNSSDFIRLHRADGTVLDEVRYDERWHQPNLAETKGIALERIALDAASPSSQNWSSSTAPSGGTPGRVNTLFLDPAAPRATPGLTIEPSPFSPDGDGFQDRTALRYTLGAAPALVRARIFDAQGRLVRTLEDALLTARNGQLLWDGRDDAGRLLRIGIYVVLLEAVSEANGTTETFKRPVVVARPLD